MNDNALPAAVVLGSRDWRWLQICRPPFGG